MVLGRRAILLLHDDSVACGPSGGPIAPGVRAGTSETQLGVASRGKIEPAVMCVTAGSNGHIALLRSPVLRINRDRPTARFRSPSYCVRLSHVLRLVAEPVKSSIFPD